MDNFLRSSALIKPPFESIKNRSSRSTKRPHLELLPVKKSFYVPNYKLENAKGKQNNNLKNCEFH